MRTVFVLQHTHVLSEDREDIKLIGIYSSRAAAEAAIERLAVQFGFRDHPGIRDCEDIYGSGFDIDEYTIDKDCWEEGYVTCLDGVASVYFHRSAVQTAFDFINSRLAEAGVTLSNPKTGKVTMNEESDSPPASKSIESSEDKIRSRIGSGLSTDLFWWFTAYVSLMCRVRFLESAANFDIILDGMNDEEYATTHTIAIDLFRKLVDDGTAIGLVVDRWGETSCFDWNGFFIVGSTTALPEESPDVLALPAERVPEHVSTGLQREDYKGFAFLVDES